MSILFISDAKIHTFNEKTGLLTILVCPSFVQSLCSTVNYKLKSFRIEEMSLSLYCFAERCKTHETHGLVWF